ncbi:MAG TPA: hypothetical protein VKG20_05415 [Methylomirabilota bacterium]|nr:hypothetical protein [Methylomirabilota bacterium]
MFEFVSADFLSLFYQASIQLGLFFLVWVGLEYVRLGFLGSRFAESARMLHSRTPAAPPSAPA